MSLALPAARIRERVAAFVEEAFLIRRDELRKTALCVLLLFFAAACLALVRMTRDALYLSASGVRRLPALYLAVALATAVGSWLYSLIADRYRSDRLLIAFYLAFALSFGLCYVLSLTGAGWFLATFYVFGEAVVLLAVIQAWTVISEHYTARDAKRVFGFMGVGNGVACTTAGFAVPVFTRFFPVNALILAAAASLLLALPFAWLLGPGTQAPQAARSGAQSARASSLFADPHLRRIALIHGLTAVAATLADYIFKVTVQQHYRGPALASFFGLYFGVCNALVVAYAVFLGSRAVSFLGLRTTALLFPVEVMASSAAFLAWPGLVAASCIKVGDSAVRYTGHGTALQILVMPLRSDLRARLRTLLEGVVKPVAGGAGALLLIGLATLGRADLLLPFALATIATCAVLAAITLPVAAEYVGALHTSVCGRRERDEEDVEAALGSSATRALLRAELLSRDSRRAVAAFELLEETGVEVDTALYVRALARPGRDLLLRLLPPLEHLRDRAFAPPLERLARLHPDLAPRILRGAAACGSAAAAAELLRLCKQEGARTDALAAIILYGSEAVRADARCSCLDLATSAREADRLDAAQVLAEVGTAALGNVADRLASDRSGKVRRLVIRGAAKGAAPDVERLVRGLFDPRTRLVASRLCAEDPAALCLAINAYRREAPLAHRDIVVRTAARACSLDAAAFLLDVVASEETTPRLHAARGLMALRRRHGTLEIDPCRVLAAAEREVRELYILGLARTEMGGACPEAPLLEAARLQRIETALALVGSVDGDPEALLDASRTLRQGTHVPSALEIIDSSLSWTGRRSLIAHLESPPADWAALYEQHFEAVPVSPPASLLDLDDRITRALALLRLAKDGGEIPGGIEAVLSDPDVLIREVARCLPGVSPHLLPPPDAGGSQSMLTTIERIVSLKHAEIFDDVAGEALVPLAASATELRLTPQQVIFREGDRDQSLFVIVSGGVRIERRGELIAHLGPGACFGELALLDGKERSATATAEVETVCLQIGRDVFFDVIAEEADIAQGVFSVLTRRLRAMLDAASSY